MYMLLGMENLVNVINVDNILQREGKLFSPHAFE